MYRRIKKPVVQLTSLLDLLFVMIFVSLMQTKVVSQEKKEVKPRPKTSTLKKMKVVKKTQIPPVPVKEKKPQKVFIKGIFSFYSSPSGPRIPEGSFRVEGSFNEETGQLMLSGTSWINRPPHYDMVPLRGRVSRDKRLFKGAIEFPGCKSFILKKTNADQSSIIGDWVGEYDCSQGLTGLKVSIF